MSETPSGPGAGPNPAPPAPRLARWIAAAAKSVAARSQVPGCLRLAARLAALAKRLAIPPAARDRIPRYRATALLFRLAVTARGCSDGVWVPSAALTVTLFILSALHLLPLFIALGQAAFFGLQVTICVLWTIRDSRNFLLVFRTLPDGGMTESLHALNQAIRGALTYGAGAEVLCHAVALTRHLEEIGVVDRVWLKQTIIGWSTIEVGLHDRPVRRRHILRSISNLQPMFNAGPRRTSNMRA